MIHYTIPGAPVSKKNHQVIATNRVTGKSFIVQSQNYRDYEAAASYFLRPKPTKPIDFPVTVRAIYYMPTRRRVDTANLNSALHDVLVKYGVLADDNRDIIASTDGTRTYYDKANPRTEVTIERYEEEYEIWKQSK